MTVRSLGGSFGLWHAGMVAVGVVLGAAKTAQAAIRFVNAAQNLPAGSQNGTSWATAFKSLSSALAVVQDGDQVWVAEGTYVPTNTNNRFAAFLVAKQVAIYGGFLPGAVVLADRDPSAHPTILSGDRGVVGDASDNCFRVAEVTKASSIDGFTIRDGNANNAGPGFISGAGTSVAFAANVEIRNCRFTENVAINRGAAAQCIGTVVLFASCTFDGNIAGDAGGALDIQQGSATFANCRFLGNTGESGGALFLLNSDGSSLQNCIFSGNTATSNAGAISLSGTDISIQNCTFVANASVALPAGAIHQASGTGVVAIGNCIFQNNVSPTSADIVNFATMTVQCSCFSGTSFAGSGNFTAVAQFVDADGADNVKGTLDDDVRLKQGSPCIDRACSAFLLQDLTDLDADGNTSEIVPFDADREARLIDDPKADQGTGSVTFLDLGAHEFTRPYRIIFVNQFARGDNDGSSWKNAFRSLQDGIAAGNAFPHPKPIEIWAAQGTYLPTTTTDRSISFRPEGSVKLLGGFQATEDSRAQRDPITYPTILSGAIASADADDNTFHVLDFSGDNVTPDLVLDGLVVMDGFAKGGSGPSIGGGVRVGAGAAPTITNCRFLSNYGQDGGGALGVYGPSSRARVVSSFFAGNEANGQGGAMLIDAGASGTTIINCTIANNVAVTGGGVALSGAASSATIANSILYFNQDDDGFGEISQLSPRDGATVNLLYTCLPCAGNAVPGLKLIGLNPRFSKLEGSDGVPGTLDDSADLAVGSPCVDSGTESFGIGGTFPADVVDLDDDANVAELLPFDLESTARIIDDPSVSNIDSPIDMGADEADFTGFGSGLIGDLDLNGVVDAADLALVLGAFGTDDPAFDLTGDCLTDGADLGVVLGSWTS